MKKVDIYTDGSCLGNPGPGGWAVVYIHENKQEIIISGGEKHTTNNRMELTAVLKALKNLTEPHKINIFSDSQYVINGYSKNWVEKWKRNNWKTAKNKPVKNDDLWKQIDKEASKHEITWNWVRGHCDNKYNELADKKAVENSNKFIDI